MPGLFGRRRSAVAVAAAVLAAAAGAAVTLAVTASSPSHVVSVGSGARTSAALKITTGTPVLDVSIAHLHGTLLRVSTPDDAPVRPVLSGSALIVLSLVPGGTVLTPPGWATATSRFDINAASGFSRLTVSRW
jgi:hypothetical protein